MSSILNEVMKTSAQIIGGVAISGLFIGGMIVGNGVYTKSQHHETWMDNRDTIIVCEDCDEVCCWEHDHWLKMSEVQTFDTFGVITPTGDTLFIPEDVRCLGYSWGDYEEIIGDYQAIKDDYPEDSEWVDNKDLVISVKKCQHGHQIITIPSLED